MASHSENANRNPETESDVEDKSERTVKIEVKNLTKRFGDLLVLDNINFNVARGELLAIVGPTGCGKTTFLNCLSKLIPTSEGNIFIDGEGFRSA